MKTLNYLTKFTLVAFLFIGLTTTAQINSSASLTENISGSKDLSNFNKLLASTSASEKLSDNNEFTVFAPTNAAFLNLDSEKYAKLPKSNDGLQQVATYHILKGSWSSEKIINKIKEDGGRSQFESLNGLPVMISTNGNGGLMIVDHLGRSCNANITNAKTSNGYLYTIDNVLLPTRS
jgi:uncharacterized surface protein with fasciclin (FAS1) repeats